MVVTVVVYHRLNETQAAELQNIIEDVLRVHDVQMRDSSSMKQVTCSVLPEVAVDLEIVDDEGCFHGRDEERKLEVMLQRAIKHIADIHGIPEQIA